MVDKRAVKLALGGFSIVFFASLLSIKPYLPKALYHNFAAIDDYRFFENRVVKTPAVTQAWKVSAKQVEGPSAETMRTLGELKTTALLMFENNELVYEKYFLTGGENIISGSFSMAKTIVALLAGFALQDGSIKNLDEPISNYIPEWGPGPEGQEVPQGKITIRNLLTMTSGLNWNESYYNPLSITTEGYYGGNLLFTALRQRVVTPPGTRYSYQSGTTELLGIVVARAVNKNLADYASEKLWKPLGAEKDALWSLDHEEGMEKAFCCFNARARDFAKIGQLLLNQGKWTTAEGVTRQLLNSEYITQMTTPHGIPDESGAPTNYYGFQTWILNTPQGNVPYARGILGQYIMVVPQKNRVVVRLGMIKGKSVDHHPVEVRALADWALNSK